jgi:hypothetical protein
MIAAYHNISCLYISYSWSCSILTCQPLKCTPYPRESRQNVRSYFKLFLPLQSLKPCLSTAMRICHFFVIIIVYLSKWIMPTSKLLTLRHSYCYKHIYLIFNFHLILYGTRLLFSRKYSTCCPSLAENIEYLITHLILVSIQQQNSSGLSETRL